MDDALNGRQSYSSAFELFSKMQALKHAEQLVDVQHVKPCTIVSHENLWLIVISLYTADLDFGLLPHACEFDRIGNKIGDNQLQHGTISVADRKGTDLPCNIPPRRILLDLGDDLVDKLLQAYPGLHGLGTPDPGKRQQIIDQVTHSLCRLE